MRETRILGSVVHEATQHFYARPRSDCAHPHRTNREGSKNVNTLPNQDEKSVNETIVFLTRAVQSLALQLQTFDSEQAKLDAEIAKLEARKSQAQKDIVAIPALLESARARLGRLKTIQAYAVEHRSEGKAYRSPQERIDRLQKKQEALQAQMQENADKILRLRERAELERIVASAEAQATD